MKLLRSILTSRRTWGLLGTAVVLYLLAFVVFGRIDMSWIMPDRNQIAQRLIVDWQTMPFFKVQNGPAEEDKGHYIYYTVPTRQITPKELAQMGLTNAAAQPVAPK